MYRYKVLSQIGQIKCAIILIVAIRKSIKYILFSQTHSQVKITRKIPKPNLYLRQKLWCPSVGDSPSETALLFGD